MFGNAPYGEAGDKTYKYVALGGILVFLAVKGRVIFALRDREMERILDLVPSEREAWKCYKLSRVIFLVLLITTAMVVEHETKVSYASRLIFSSSSCAVGVLLSSACISTVAMLLRDKNLGREDIKLPLSLDTTV